VHEVVNGLLSRSDASIARHIPLAVIPCGSSNTLAHTLGIYSPQQAAEKLIQGLTRPLDILSITSTPPDMWLPPGRALYSFQGIGWGMTSEMTSVAEKLRWWVSPTPLSPLRLTLAAILTILTTLTLPRYSAKLMFLPLPTQAASRALHFSHNSPIPNPHPAPDPNSASPSNCYNNNDNNHNDNTNSNNLTTSHHFQANHTPYNNNDICAVNNAQCAGCEQPMKYNKGKRPSTDLKDWVIVDGKTDGLLFFTASNTPGKLSPHAHLSDGYMDISLIMHCSRLRLTRLLMKDDKLAIDTHPPQDGSAASALGLNPPASGNTEACLPNNGYHIRQYKTSQIRLEVDRYFFVCFYSLVNFR
jgi:hypothetical protein